MNPCRQTQAAVFDCSGQNLLHVPKFPPSTRIIDLSRNNITAVNDSFQCLEHLEFLDMSNNRIEIFYLSTTRCLTNLLKLDLSANCLQEGSFSFPTNPLILLDLRIHFNLYNAYPEKFLSVMPSLRSLHIDVYEGFTFGNGFPALRNLTEIHFYPRNSFKLQNDSFLALRYTQIKSMNMQFSSFVYDVEIDVFSPFLHLTDLTFNIGLRCDIRQALRALFGLKGRRMENLNLNNNLLYAARATHLTDQDIYYLKTMCVKRVDLSRCSVSKIPYSIAESRFANCLEEIIIGDNAFENEEFVPVVSILSYRNIRSFDCSYSKLYHPNLHRVRKANTTLQSKRVTNLTFTFPESLTTVKISGYDLHFVGSNIFDNYVNNSRVIGKGLEVIDLAFTQALLCSKDKGTPIMFDTNIKYLDLTHSICNHLDSTFLKSMTTLETLVFRNSELAEGLENDPNGILFKGLFNLRSLDMENNLLDHLHDDLFLDQSLSLKTLNLRSNVFRHIPEAIQNAHQLRLLDMENNKLLSLSKMDTDILDKCKEAQVRISRNPFVCSCENLHMIQCLETNQRRILDFENVNCTGGEPLKNLTEQIREFELKCLGTFWLKFSASLCIVLVVVIIGSAICYRYRVYIEYMYLILVSSPPKFNTDDRYAYDGFISYSAKDTDWVTQVLYKRLAEEMKLKICIHHKDFIPGRPIANEILRCIDESRKVIFVVTRNFLESDWGNYELEMARIHAFRSGRSGLLLILKDELLIEEMPDLLKKMWWKVVCMKWPTQETSDERKLFWHNLKIAMET